MSRRDRREHGRKKAKPTFDYSNVTLRELRFDTPKASEMFMNLRYFDDAYKGSTNNAVRLPPINESVSNTASSGGMVFKAFPHGLMYGDQLSLMGGMGVFVAVPLGILAWGMSSGGAKAIFVLDSLGGAILIAIFILLLLVTVPLGLLTFLWDVMGYRFSKSALLDRNAGKVHVFTDKSLPWRGYRHTLATYDWQCIRAEVDSMNVFTGAVGRSEVGLRCVVMDRPGGTEVIDQFSLGVNMPAHHIQPLLDTWEHARRFMQREGPLFADQHDGPNPSLGRQPIWKYLWLFPELEVTTTIDLFKIGWEEKSLLTLFMAAVGIVLIPALPLIALFGLFPWISSLCKREPHWPAEILASVGGNALRGRDLDAWRGVVPQPRPVIDGDQQPALR